MNLFFVQHQFAKGVFWVMFFTKSAIFPSFHLQIAPKFTQKRTIILIADLALNVKSYGFLPLEDSMLQF